jgi:sulfate permease, SulP family
MGTSSSLRKGLGMVVSPSLLHYQRSWLVPDLSAGITIGALSIPASLGYAELAGLPPVYGLYAALIGMAVFGLFGSCRHLVLGPDSAFAALVGATLFGVAGHNPARAAALAPVLAIMVGMLFLAFGLARIGFLADFLSQPLLAGYMTGLAITVIIGQIPKIMGIRAPSTSTIGKVHDMLTGLDDIEWRSLALGIATIALAVGVRHLLPRFPVVVALLGLGIFLVLATDIERHGVAVLGNIPEGLPEVKVPGIHFDDVTGMLPGALALALLGFADAVLQGRQYSRDGKYRAAPDRDMIVAGVANLAVAGGSGYPIGASASRSVTALSSGGKSTLASITGALVIGLTLLFLAPALEDVPVPVLAGVVIASALRVVAWQPIRALWPARKTELIVALSAMTGVVLAGVLTGVAIAVGISLLDFVRRASRPHDAVLGQRPGRPGWFDISRHSTRTEPGLVVYRFDAPLFFANAAVFRQRVLGLVDASDEPVRWLVVHGPAIVDIDATATTMLDDLKHDLAGRGITLALTGTVGSFHDRLARNQAEVIDRELRFKTIEEAVVAFRASHGLRADRPEGVEIAWPGSTPAEPPT